MFSIAVEYERRKGSLDRHIEIKLRGNQSATWVKPELRQVHLPVNALAFSICPTFRDLYLEYVEHIGRPPSWQRYVGRVVDKLYKKIFHEGRSYSESTPTSTFDIYSHLINASDTMIESTLRSFRDDLRAIDPPPNDETKIKLAVNLKKIIRYEAIQVSAVMEFQLSRLPSASPDTIFCQFFSLNPDASLHSLRQGFTSPATPDFLLNNRVIGDVKCGKWKDCFEYTMVAYALAYEDSLEGEINLVVYCKWRWLIAAPFLSTKEHELIF